MSDALLELENVTAGYGGAVVIDDVSLTLAEGAGLALLGRNGNGKTTLARLLAAQLAPAESPSSPLGRSVQVVMETDPSDFPEAPPKDATPEDSVHADGLLSTDSSIALPEEDEVEG